jgi:uncharacterized protein (DUF433 family)
MSTTANYPHIAIDADGTARIGRTRYKVNHLAAEHYQHGWSAEEFLRQHGDLLPEEVYAALAYFYDHFDEMVDEMKRTLATSEGLRVGQTLSRADLLERRQGGKS